MDTNTSQTGGVSKRLRYEVLRRDGFTCQICGAKAAESELEVDHVIPQSLGGPTVASNLQTACIDCNQGKASTSPDQASVDALSEHAERWAQAVRISQIFAQRKEQDLIFGAGHIKTAWDRWSVNGLPVSIPENWIFSVKTWMQAGLSIDTMLDLIPVAMHGPAAPAVKWRYFAGCCWNKVRDLSEFADNVMKNADEAGLTTDTMREWADQHEGESERNR